LLAVPKKPAGKSARSTQAKKKVRRTRISAAGGNRIDVEGLQASTYVE
jgi:hypothetical protein